MSKSSSSLTPMEEGELFFENLKGWKRAPEVAERFGCSIATIYAWRAKAKTMQVPEDLFMKFNGQLYIQVDVLKRWVSSQNGVTGKRRLRRV